MLFRRRQTESLLERVRVHLWPRRSWSRSGRYVVYRLRRLSATPHAIALGFADRRFRRGHALYRHAYGHGRIARLDHRRQRCRLGSRHLLRQSADLSLSVVRELRSRQRLAWRQGDQKERSTCPMVSSNPRFDHLWPILKPMSLGCVPVGLAVATACYFLVRPMVDAYQHRRRRELHLRHRRPCRRHAGSSAVTAPASHPPRHQHRSRGDAA